jgi:hypothetical protein
MCCGAAAIAVWLVEAGSMAIAHSSGALGLLILLCPGMLPAFFGLFDSEYTAWAVAVIVTAAYYLFIWQALRAARNRHG